MRNDDGGDDESARRERDHFNERAMQQGARGGCVFSSKVRTDDSER